jgi:hypothetical protein
VSSEDDVPRVAELVEQFDNANVPTDAMDIIELHNVQQYLEHGFVPREYTEKEREVATSRIGQIRSAGTPVPPSSAVV